MAVSLSIKSYLIVKKGQLIAIDFIHTRGGTAIDCPTKKTWATSTLVSKAKLKVLDCNLAQNRVKSMQIPDGIIN